MATNTVRGATLAAAALLAAACGSNAAAPSPVTSVRPTSTAGVSQSSAPSVATSPGRTSTPPATRNPSAGYTDLKGWLVFEHFGQAPDGSTPTFNFDNRMIWMVHADGSGLHELAPMKPLDGKSSPDISMDGRTVAFSSWSPHSQIWTVPIDDSADPTLVSTDCSGRPGNCQEYEPSWSGDGNSLAYVHASGVGTAAYTEIAMRNLQTGETRSLEQTRMPGTTGYVTQPSLSPDGQQVVYYVVSQTATQEHPTGTKLLVAATDSSGVQELPRPTGAIWTSDPDWSPDGKSIVFGGLPNRESEGWGDPPEDATDGIFTINPDGTDLFSVCAACLRTPLGFGGPNIPSWTSDGRILAWGYKTWALMNADGSDAAHINMAKLTWNGDGLGYNYAAVLQPTP